MTPEFYRQRLLDSLASLNHALGREAAGEVVITLHPDPFVRLAMDLDLLSAGDDPADRWELRTADGRRPEIGDWLQSFRVRNFRFEKGKE